MTLFLSLPMALGSDGENCKISSTRDVELDCVMGLALIIHSGPWTVSMW